MQPYAQAPVELSFGDVDPIPLDVSNDAFHQRLVALHRQLAESFSSTVGAPSVPPWRDDPTRERTAALPAAAFGSSTPTFASNPLRNVPAARAPLAGGHLRVVQNAGQGRYPVSVATHAAVTQPTFLHEVDAPAVADARAGRSPRWSRPGLVAVALLTLAASAVATFVAVGGLTDRQDSARSSAPAAQAPAAAAPSAGAAAPKVAKPAAAYQAVDPRLPRVQPGNVVYERVVVRDRVVELAPGVHYRAWTFDGAATARPMHVRVGQTIKVTFVNKGSIAHSLDFHSFEAPPNVAFRDIPPGGKMTYTYRATAPGVYLYHCVTMPATAHVGNGMAGLVVVDPKRPLPKVDHEFGLTVQEWYLDGDGKASPASMDHAKARAMQPTYVTFNGRARGYVDAPIKVGVGDTARIYIANAGPGLASSPHIVGAIFDRVYPEGDLLGAHRNVQTTVAPAGGGTAFDVSFERAGFYTFVDHSFPKVDLGAVAMIQVGNPVESMPLH